MLGGQERRAADWRRQEAGNGRAEGSSALGDGGRAATAAWPPSDIEATHVHTFESSHLEGLCIGDLL